MRNNLRQVGLCLVVCVSLSLISCSTASNFFSQIGSKKDSKSTTTQDVQKGTKNKGDSFSVSSQNSKENNLKNYSLPTAIHVIDANTFRIEFSYPVVWDSLLSVLIRNYNIILADNSSGIISTDWDSFYLKENTLRNRLSVKVKKLSYNTTELIFHNSVEKLKTTTSYVWLPEPDKYNEIERVINNIAILLNQPPVKISYSTTGNVKKIIQR